MRGFFNKASRDAARLLKAVQKGDLEKVKKLLAAGANVDAKDKYGQTALMHAASNGFGDILQTLIDHDACIDATDKHGWTALICAESGNIAQTLIDCGADVNKKTKSGYTVLMVMANWGRVEVLQTLVDNGADIHMTNDNGQTALDYAIAQGARRLYSMTGVAIDILQKTVDAEEQKARDDEAQKISKLEKRIAELEREMKNLRPQKGPSPKNKGSDGNKKRLGKLATALDKQP